MLGKVVLPLLLSTQVTAFSPQQPSTQSLAKVGFVLSENGTLSRIGGILDSDPDFNNAMRSVRSDRSKLIEASTLSEERLLEIKTTLMIKLLLEENVLSPPLNDNPHLLLQEMDELAKIHFSIEALLPLTGLHSEADAEVKKLQSSYAMKLSAL